MAPPAKRTRLDGIRDLQGTRVSDSFLSNFITTMSLQSGSACAASTMRNCMRESHFLTLAGATTLALQLPEGKVHNWTIVQPHLLLSIFASSSNGFMELIHRTRELFPPPQLWRMIMYSDEITGGNPLRPDNHAKVTVFYASFLEFGLELRSEYCWLPIGVLQYEIVNASLGGLSGIMRRLCASILKESGCMSGVVVKCPSPTLMFWRMTNMLGDEAALKAAVAAKGASGCRPCILCRNILAKGRAPTDHPYLRDISESNSASFDLATDQDIWDLTDQLSTQAGLITKAKFEQLEKAAGMRHEEHGLLQDKALRDCVSPTSLTFDAMHCLYSQGIMAQELHLFLKRCKEKLKLSFADFKTYCDADWRIVKSSRLSARSVFTEGREAATKNSFEGFASEVVSAIPLVRQLAETTFGVDSTMRAELLSFRSMHDVHNQLRDMKNSPAPTSDDCSQLQRLQRRHMNLFQEAYGSDEIRPKHHYALHLPDHIRRDGLVLDCFCLERKHKSVKHFATLCTTSSKTFDASVLARMIEEQKHELQSFSIADALIGRTSENGVVAQSIGARTAIVASKVRCKHVTISVGDVLLIGHADKAMQILACVEADGLRFLVKPFQFEKDFGYGQVWKPSTDRAIAQCSCDCEFRIPSYWSFEPDGCLLTLA